MRTRWIRWSLILGGVFNMTLGLVFFNSRLLNGFFKLALWLEELFFTSAPLPFPQHPVHLLLIHGFGAAALILGGTLIYCSREPVRMLPFIFFDGLGRLLFGSLMVFYVIRFFLMKIILIFGLIELTFAVLYLLISWKLAEP